ncbi:helix-turn-helix domain-containing protein [Microbispora hainanensis]|uniref:Helix-turn-helix transcriptional regulator n=1 Tax=Microbispora hainanensis TaxID=568844 RepID=A0A544XXJ8_9ACTN|nr:helix-turn-helix domain-containing protein [Microbispora hainanensis]TQS09201.1 helix-turn-helix transcriptional regulator [Microbispora hainanensis]
MNDRELGRRVAYWRRRRGLTQQILADRLGRSISWLRKVEAGVRSADRLSVLDSLCEALNVDLQTLIGEEPVRSGTVCIDDAQVEHIRNAMERYALNAGPGDLARLRRQVAYAWSAFEVADYDVISQVLPETLENAQSNHAALGTEESARLLAEAYQITSSTLRKLGEHSLAWLAGDRSMAAARQIGDLSLLAAAGWRIALALLSMGRAEPALDMLVGLANRLSAESDTEERRALYGHVLVQGAMAAAALGRHPTVRALIAEAREAARSVDVAGNYHWLAFGPANVTIHEVAALVALGEGGLAVEVAGGADPSALAAMRRERRAAFLVDVARGYSQWGHREEAVRTLLEAERVASREVRCRPLSQAIIADVLRRTKGPAPTDLVRLAARAGAQA